MVPNQTDKIGIDAPRGWEHKSGYRLDHDGASIQYIDEWGDYWAIVEATHAECGGDDLGLEYIAVIFERQNDGSEEPVYGHNIYADKREAMDELEAAMFDLNPNLPAPTELRGRRELTGVDHDGARYCLDCARALLGDAEYERYIEEPETVAYGGPVWIDSETDYEQHCDTCLRFIETDVIR